GLAQLERGVLCANSVVRSLRERSHPAERDGYTGVDEVVAKRSPQHSPSPRGRGPGWGQEVGAKTRPHPNPPPQGEGMRWSSLVHSLAADVEQRQRELPWHEEFDCDVPCSCQRDDIHAASERLASVMDDTGVKLRSIRARLVFPREF